MPQAPTSSNPKRQTWQRILIWLGIALLALFIVILLMGLVPTATKGLTPEPNPAASYDEAVARFNQVVAQEEGKAKASGQSILMSHDGPT